MEQESWCVCSSGTARAGTSVNRTFLLEPSTEGAQCGFFLLPFILFIYKEMEEQKNPHA